LAAPVPPPALDDIQDVKVTKDMLGLAKHIVSQKAGHFEADKIEDQYETMVPLSRRARMWPNSILTPTTSRQGMENSASGIG
jgi:hypothetical protein